MPKESVWCEKKLRRKVAQRRKRGQSFPERSQRQRADKEGDAKGEGPKAPVWGADCMPNTLQTAKWTAGGRGHPET